MTTNIINAIVTAYVATGNLDASGHIPKVGITCAGPRNIPLYTKVYIEHVGWRLVTDRINKRFNGRFDIFVADKSTALKFGKQTLKVTIYNS